MNGFLDRYLGLSVEETAVVLAAIPMIIAVVLVLHRSKYRPTLTSWVNDIVGLSRRRYARWFLREFGAMQDIYLQKIHKLDLSAVYISLSLRGRGKVEQRQLATSVLGDVRTKRRIIITGDPGSGKSTVLKAYGAGVLRKRRRRDDSDLRAISPSGEIPFFVPLRHFARHARGKNSLARYLAREILLKAGINDGAAFLRRVLRRQRCLVMLDGLDEVAEAELETVNRAIYEFVNNDTGDLPSARARVLLSCRQQNFDRTAGRWIPTFASAAYSLAPMSDVEIYRYLLKREKEKDFPGNRSIGRFFVAIRASETMDLHRVPLILAISVGLYINLDAYEIPRSIARFYDVMIDELLRRHDFRGDESGERNEFQAEEKYQFLRQFALDMARRPGRFEDFSFEEAADAARRATRRMTHVRDDQAEGFIREIVNRSGLLRVSSVENEYVFAHRSIHEYLVALQLAREPVGGCRELLGRTIDPQWRHVVELFTTLDHPQVDPFLRELSALNLPLAVYCLAGARATDDVARPILSSVREALRVPENVPTHLPALVAAVRAPRAAISDFAAAMVRDALRDPAIVGQLTLTRDQDDAVLVLLAALSDTNSTDVVALVPDLAGLLPDDDPRTIGPLWRCLALSGVLRTPAAGRIVTRLLGAVMAEPCFEELERQPTYHFPDLGDDRVRSQLRRKAYPFEDGVERETDGVPQESNFVTLLAVADYLQVIPAEPNRFFEAKNAGELERVERARSQTVSFGPFWPVRSLFIVAYVAAVVASLANVATDWRIVTRPYAWWSPFFLLAPSAAILVVVSAVERVRRTKLSRSWPSGVVPCVVFALITVFAARRVHWQTLRSSGDVTSGWTSGSFGPWPAISTTALTVAMVFAVETLGQFRLAAPTRFARLRPLNLGSVAIFGGAGYLSWLTWQAEGRSALVEAYRWRIVFLFLAPVVLVLVSGRGRYWRYFHYGSGGLRDLSNPWIKNGDSTGRWHRDRRTSRRSIVGPPASHILFLTAPYCLAFAPIAGISMLEYFVVVTGVILLAFWGPALPYFDRDRRIYLRRPSVYVDVYDDPRSKHWVQPMPTMT